MFRWGKIIDCEPSRFLEEIDDKYLDWKNLNIGNSFNRSGLDASLLEDSFSQTSKFVRKKEKLKLNQPTPPKSNFKPSKKAQITNQSDVNSIERTAGNSVVPDRFGGGR